MTTRTLMLAGKILVAIVVIHFAWTHFSHKPALAPHTSAAKTVPAAHVEPPTDHRSQAQWQADCDPAQAIQPASGVISFWCQTPYNNKFDHDQALPSDWRWL